MGGLQAQSNFSLRPDLITAPLPTLGGSAAVPSTVDVYVNNIKTFSQSVGAGPFSVSNVPLISGAGNAELVIRDSAGHEIKSTTPFYASARCRYQPPNAGRADLAADALTRVRLACGVVSNRV